MLSISVPTIAVKEDDCTRFGEQKERLTSSLLMRTSRWPPTYPAHQKRKARDLNPTRAVTAPITRRWHPSLSPAPVLRHQVQATCLLRLCPTFRVRHGRPLPQAPYALRLFRVLRVSFFPLLKVTFQAPFFPCLIPTLQVSFFPRSILKRRAMYRVTCPQLFRQKVWTPYEEVRANPVVSSSSSRCHEKSVCYDCWSPPVLVKSLDALLFALRAKPIFTCILADVSLARRIVFQVISTAHIQARRKTKIRLPFTAKFTVKILSIRLQRISR